MGRILAIIWMFTGIVIVSAFTAAITASLTVSRLETSIDGLADLRRVRVGTIPHSSSAAFLSDKSIGFEPFTSLDDGLAALNTKEVDAFVYDAPLLRYTVSRHFDGTITVLPRAFVRQDYGIALPPGSPLREPINSALLRQIQDPRWQDVLRRYLGVSDE